MSPRLFFAAIFAACAVALLAKPAERLMTPSGPGRVVEEFFAALFAGDLETLDRLTLQPLERGPDTLTQLGRGLGPIGVQVRSVKIDGTRADAMAWLGRGETTLRARVWLTQLEGDGGPSWRVRSVQLFRPDAVDDADAEKAASALQTLDSLDGVEIESTPER